jgi:hypothetical protein
MTKVSRAVHPLVGVWRLVSVTARGSDGTARPEVYGPAPVGYLTYTADGQMMVMFAQGDRPPLSGNPTSPFALGSVPAAEMAQAFASFSAYAGTYSIQGDAVHHHLVIASIPNRVGATLVRTFVIQGHRLTLTTQKTMEQGVATAYELVWQRNAAGQDTSRPTDT